jgi:DNA/RNA endonuclease YhcR with UshA esterase domain
MSQCPSCGRFAGPYEACPYCGARLSGRISIRVVKIAAVVLATLGLAALWFAATRAEVPLIQIGQAGATMNMAYVRIQGRCTRAPTYDPEGEYLSFWIADETGEMLVSAYRAETHALIEQGRVPALGDWVEVAGTLRVREDFLALTANVPEQLRIVRAEPVERAIGEITAEDLYLRVRVRGEVRAVYSPYEGLMLVTLRDETGEIPVAVDENLVALGGPLPALAAGQPVEVVAAVSLYRDTPQLVPASTADVVLLGEAPVAATRPIGEVTTADVGETLTLRGTLGEPEPFSSGVKFVLSDGSDAIVLLLWQDVYDAIPGTEQLVAGALVTVTGEIEEYQGDLEIIPETEGVEVGR